jgi:lipid-binding SYLF domain-containing protein
MILMTRMAAAQSASEEAARIKEAGVVLQEITAAPDKGVPKSVLDKAEAIAIFPGVLKAGLLIGGHRGHGVISVRDRKAHTWSAPGFLTLTGGSIGAQIGAQATDLVLIVMNQRGVNNLIANEFKIGGDASVAAGPVGRDAEASTDIQMRAEILSYSRARGLFAGVTLKGSAIKEDEDANQRFYGKPLRNRQILFEPMKSAPAPVSELQDLLRKIAM